MNPRGRRPASSPDARQAIITAARAAFARDGYGTSLRGIAREAGVDPALVHHYFPDRGRLFTAAIIADDDGEVFDISALANRLATVPIERAGEQMLRQYLTVWDSLGAQRFTAMIRVAMNDDLAVAGLQASISDGLIEPLVRRHTSDRPLLRAQLIAGVMVGLGVTRWVTGLSEIEARPVEELVALSAPTIQRYLTGELPGDGRPG